MFFKSSSGQEAGLERPFPTSSKRAAFPGLRAVEGRRLWGREMHRTRSAHRPVYRGLLSGRRVGGSGFSGSPNVRTAPCFSIEVKTCTTGQREGLKVRTLTAKPDNLSGSLDLTEWKKESGSASCPLISTWTLPHVHCGLLQEVNTT